jgi:hypothetical protein
MSILIKLGECNFCGEKMEEISFSHTINGGVIVWLDRKETATMYSCTSQDCRQCGVVKIIPSTPKE